MSNENIEMIVDDRLGKQREGCIENFLQKKDYYKNAVAQILTVVVVLSGIFAGVIAWSYSPIKDIATLKVKIEVIDEKLDMIIRNNGGKHD